MPDFSLRVRLCFFLHHHSYSARRSRMTAEVFLFCHDVLMLNEYIKERVQTVSLPLLSGKVAAEPSEGVSVSRNEKRVSYGTVLNTCLSFLNEVMASEPFFEEQSDVVKMSETPYPTNGSGKNLAKDTRIKYFPLCTQACPYRLAGSALPSAFGGSVQLRKKKIMDF